MSTDPTLADLIQERIHRTGETYKDIAARGGISRANVHRLATETETNSGTSGVPRKSTLEGLAKGLSLPLTVVRRAALVSAGEADPSDEPAARNSAEQRLLSAIADLSQDDIDLLRSIALVLKDRHGR